MHVVLFLNSPGRVATPPCMPGLIFALEATMDSPQLNTQQEWRGLCELAIREYDPEKFSAILTELNRLLEERDQNRRRESAQGSY